ncbi:MAG: purL, partial [Chloroflexi bacterium]|nr:purL [Chloroflexota bacterium]
DEILLLGAGDVSLAGSVYAQKQGLPVSGHPALLDIELECRVQAVCRQAIEQGILSSAHDCSDGGLAVTLVESALAGNIGASIDPLPDAIPANVALFGEGPARIIVSLPAHKADELAALAESNGVPPTRLGRVGGRSLTVDGQFSLDLDDLSKAHSSALASLFDLG